MTSSLISLLLFVSLVCVESQNFCQSYKRNNYSLIVYSQSNDTIVLIVDRHFWRLQENNSDLVFDRQDFEASNSSEQWTQSNYVSALPIYNETDERFRGLILAQESSNMAPSQNNTNPFIRNYSLHYYNFYDNYFELTFKSDFVPFSGHKFEKTVVFTIFDEKLNVDIRQYKDNDSQNYKIEIRYQLERKLIDRNITDTISEQLDKLANFSTNIPIIGSYLNSRKQIILFFRIEDDIKYCAIDQCKRKSYKVLINCFETKGTFYSQFDTKVFVIILMVIIFFVVIALILIFWYKEHQKKYKSITIPNTSETLTIESKSVSTVNTIKSGPTIDSSETLKSETSVNDVSTQRNENKIKPSKTKMKTTSKKSSKLKK